MIHFSTDDDRWILTYIPDNNPAWVEKEFEEGNEIFLKRTFTFKKNDLHYDLSSDTSQEEEIFEEKEYQFSFSEPLDNEYYKIKKGVLIDERDIYFHKDITLEPSFFVAYQNISIFGSIEVLVNEDIIIGGDKKSAIPFDEFQNLLQQFPNTYELKRYAQARISTVLRNYIDTAADGTKKYQTYMNKKISRKGADLFTGLKEMELVKYRAVHSKLIEMLKNEDQYNEKQWQKEIVEIILLLYPKYISVFRDVPVKDEKIADRFLDFMLVDSSGHIDVIEIKRPFDNCILTAGKYRNNFIPLRELSGTIMQLEKYIYYLNRWGKEGEKYLSNRYANELPAGFEIKITNPSGIIIMGRSNSLSVEQLHDFEVVRRKYKNVIDLVTYDDLIHRLGFIIEQLQKR